MKRGPGTWGMFQLFLVILPNVPCMYYVHKYMWQHLCSVWSIYGMCTYHGLFDTCAQIPSFFQLLCGHSPVICLFQKNMQVKASLRPGEKDTNSPGFEPPTSGSNT